MRLTDYTGDATKALTTSGQTNRTVMLAQMVSQFGIDDVPREKPMGAVSAFM